MRCGKKKKAKKRNVASLNCDCKYKIHTGLFKDLVWRKQCNDFLHWIHIEAMTVWVKTILKLISVVSFYPFKGATRMFKIMCCGLHYIYIFLFNIGFFFFNQSSILYTSVYTCQSQSPNSAHHHPHPTAVFLPWCPYVCSLHLCLNFCPANRFICTIFLGSTYMR